MSKPSPQPAIMTKSDFADLCGVNKSRVSNWIRDGRITADALSGTGRSARIIVERAQAQLRARLDPYQMLSTGNGARTNLGDKPRPVVEAEDDPPSDDAALLWSVLAEVPANAAWEAARPGESLQRAFDTFMNMRLDTTAEMRRRGFALPEGIDHFEPVDWRALAEEIGLASIDAAAMLADWQRRRDAD